jgi:intracellular multiplication protein IcmV
MLFVGMRVCMKLSGAFKLSRKTFFNPSAWFGFDALKAQHQVIRQNLGTVFTADKPTREESFEEAVQRLGLTKEDVKQRISVSLRYTVIFFMTGLLVFFYAFYLLFRYKYIFPWIMGLAASAILFAQAFKFHFWVFQMRKRKLGMTFSEWLDSTLGVKSKSA